MVTSEAQICNIALARVGQREFIDSLVQTSTASRLCAALYSPARDAALEAFPWPFATRRVALAALANATYSGWTHAYVLPSDCIAMRDIYSGVRTPEALARVPYSIELGNDSEGNPSLRVLLTDAEAAEVSYTARVTTVALYPPLFVDALAWKMASDLALSLPVKPQVGLAMLQGYRLALETAMASQLRQRQGDVPAESEFIRAR